MKSGKEFSPRSGEATISKPLYIYKDARTKKRPPNVCGRHHEWCQREIYGAHKKNGHLHIRFFWFDFRLGLRNALRDFSGL
jgi:hypothetical protein